jgi:outer membrane lipoprotein-sorting protein
MPILKRVLMLFFAVLLSSAIVACQEKEGPAEKAGKKLDEAVEKMGEKLEEAGDKAKEATQN